MNHRGGVAFFLLFVGSLFPGVVLAQADTANTQDALGRLRQKAVSVLEELALAERQTRKLESEAEKAEVRAKDAAARLEQLKSEELAALNTLTAQLDMLAPRLRARYELGKRKNAMLLLSSVSMAELMWRWRTLEQVLERDLALLAGAKEVFDQLLSRRALLEKAKLELAGRYRLAERTRIEATFRKAELANIYQSLWKETDLKEKALRELEKVQSDLSHYVEGIQKEPGRAFFARKKGKMFFPVKGVIEVGFGRVLNPRFNTVTFHKGLDIRAPEGSPVVSVGSGRVVHAGRFRGYGDLVIVDHGEGYFSLYAHLASMHRAVGDLVVEQEVLGTVGDTDSLKGPFLYFEIRENGKPVNPQKWLGAMP